MQGNSRQAAARRPSRQQAFLKALKDTVNVTLSCRRAGLSRRTVYDWREKNEAFARRWDEVLDEGIDLLEAELHRRAFEGVERPVFYKGQQCGTWQFYSDAVAMFLLRAHRPEKYRDRTTPERGGGSGGDGGDAEARAIQKLMQSIAGSSRGLPASAANAASEDKPADKIGDRRPP